MSQKLPFISLILATLNGETRIARTLDSIFAMDYPKDRYEVIVVVDGSTDNTLEVLETFRTVKVVSPGFWQGIPGARNAALKEATGDIVIGTDDDTLLPANLFKEIAAAYQVHPDAAAIASVLTEPPTIHGLADHYMAATGSGNPPSVKLNPSQSIWKRFTSYVSDMIKPRSQETEIYQVSRVYGATATFPMEVLRAVDGWDADLHWVEDTDICERIARKFPHRKFFATPKAQIVHDPKMTVWKMWKRSYLRGPVTLKFYRKFNLVPPIFPFPLAFLASLLVTAVINPWLTPVAALVMPMVLYFWWPLRAIRQKRPLYVAMPYVQLGEELASLAGIIRGYVKLLGIRPLARTLVHQFKSDSLFRNAVYLMTSTAVMSVLGFGFWFFVAHFYAPAAIGAASALISISLLISNFSYLGMDSGLVRFLPKSDNQSQKINAALIMVGAAAALATLIYAVLGIGSDLPFFATSLATKLLLAGLMTIVVLNSLTDNVFIANRRAGYHTITYAVLGTTKLILPLFLVTLGSLGIFLAYIASAGISLLLTFAFMRRAANYRFFTKPDWSFIKTTRKYVTANYFARLTSGLPSQLMPMLIVTRLGAAEAAYFSMAWTMSNLLYVIPSATANSLLAESSADEGSHRRHLSHSAKMLATMLVPSVVGAILVAPYLLQLFGPNYAKNGTLLFQIFAFGTFLTAINTIGNTVLNVARRTHAVMVLQAIIATTNLALAVLLMRFGLVGIGIAYVCAQLAGNLTLLVALAAARKKADRARLKPDKTLLDQFGVLYGLGDAWFSNDLGGGDRSATVIVSQGRDKYVLKVSHTQKRDLTHTSREVDFMEYLRDHGIPVPKVIPNAQGQLVSTVADETGTWSGVLMSYIEGSHPERLNNALITNMAELQGQIHQAGIRYMLDHPDIKLTQTKSTLLPVPKGLSHFDFYHSNIFVRGAKIVSVIDFEGMRADSLVGCIGYTLTWLQEEHATKSDLETYIAAYQSVRKLQWLERLILRVALAVRGHSLRLLALKM
jgi:O-antigen/teichoic acid export membrane protein/glycosyltransferase involved in cell wall biosynthesis